MANYWNKISIKLGFERFWSEYGRMPTAREIDEYNYLPSARQIQRRFGGLEKLRQEFGFKIKHFGKGKSRSEKAKEINIRSLKVEKEIGKILIERFGECFVHFERPFAGSKHRFDFYIYSPDGNFAVPEAFDI